MVKQSWFLSGLSLIFLGSACDQATSLEVPEVTADPSDPQTPATVDPAIAADVAAGRSREAIVVLSDEALGRKAAVFHSSVSKDAFASYLVGRQTSLGGIKANVTRAAGGDLTALETYDQLPVMHVRIDSAAALAALASQPNVVAVVEDRAMEAFDSVPANLALVGQPTAAAAGNVGAGTTVAVLDTGADYTRAPFNCTAPGQPAACPVVVAKDFAAADGVLDSSPYHGTNVAGIVRSVAPGAKIAALDVFDGNWAYTSRVLSAINWCIVNKTTYNIVAINLSLGSGVYGSACLLDPFAPAIAAARAAGILTAVAAGNGASASGISSPACVPSAVSVGAVYATNVGPLFTSVCADLSSAADQVACFSNSASLLTLWAPGVGITAAGITMSGTSQATPHVAGAIAVLAAALPTSGPDALLARLKMSNATVTDKRNQVAKPRLDLAAALAGDSSPPPNPSAPSAPAGAVAINDGAAFTKSPSVTVSVATTSGTATDVCLSATTTCADWQPYAPRLPFTLTAGDGAKRVYVWWKGAGATSSGPSSAAIVLDTTAPTNVFLVAVVVGRTALLTWPPATDAGAGLASYKVVSAVGSPPASCNAGAPIYSGMANVLKVSNLPTGTTYFRVCAVDKLGTMNSGATASARVATK